MNKKNTIIIIFVFVIILVIAAAGYYVFFNSKKETEIELIDKEALQEEILELEKILPEAQEEYPLAEIIIGKVRRDATVCENLYVLSASDFRILDEEFKGSRVRPDGSFTTIVSGASPQSLFVVDEKKNACLSGAYFPDDLDPIIIDDKSTAINMVFSLGIIKIDKVGYEEIQKLESFQKVHQFIKGDLKKKTLTDINASFFLEEDDILFDLVTELTEEIHELLFKNP